jgi:hypothetical protein
MRKAWALIDVGEVLVGPPFETEEVARSTLESMSYFGDLLEVREIDFNDEPLDEEGEELKERLKEMLKNTLNFHMSKGPEFYAMNLKERFRCIINMINDIEVVKGSSLSSESGVEQVDVKDFVNKL